MEVPRPTGLWRLPSETAPGPTIYRACTAVSEPVAVYPLIGLVTFEVRPLLEFKEGTDTIRAKLAEAQEAMAGR
jgi:hypothetical protein